MKYYKMVDGQQVFSDNPKIPEKVLFITSLNRWKSNPTAEEIAAEGWLPFIPPVVPPQPQSEPAMAEVMEAVKRMLSSETAQMSDEDALDIAALFATWSSKIGQAVTTGERLWDDGKLWKVLQPHTVQQNWRPGDSPSLYVEVSIVEIPEWRQPLGAQDAYMSGDRVKHNGSNWESDVDNNTWEPGVYGWTQLPS